MAYSFNPFSGGLDDSGTPGIPDASSDNLVYGRKNGQWLTHTKEDLINAESGPYLTLIINGDNTVTGIEGSIGGYAYAERNDLLGLQIGRSCTSIGSYAFYGCGGFTGSLVIPDSVTTINTGAFSNSPGFNSLYLGSSITSIGDRAFFGDFNFTGSLTIPGTTSIGSYAFYGCSFSGLNVTGTSVGSYAFQYCNYVSGPLSLANTITAINSYAFRSCSGFNGTLTIGNSVTNIGSYAFYGCSSFTGSLTIPNSVTSIGSYAFYQCGGFNGSLTIGNSVTNIGSYAFTGCPGFTGSLTIPNSVTNIGSYAFTGCSGFTGSLTIPNSVTNIGSYAFYNCNNFINVDCYTEKTIIDAAYEVFKGTGILTIYARSTDSTWTAGSGQTIGGKSGITVIKDLT